MRDPTPGQNPDSGVMRLRLLTPTPHPWFRGSMLSVLFEVECIRHLDSFHLSSSADSGPSCGAGAPLFPPCPFTSSSFSPFYFSLSVIGFTYFLLLSIPCFSTRIAPLRFQAGGRRRRPNLGFVCVLLCNLCYLYSLVKVDCSVLFYLV